MDVVVALLLLEVVIQWTLDNRLFVSGRIKRIQLRKSCVFDKQYLEQKRNHIHCLLKNSPVELQAFQLSSVTNNTYFTIMREEVQVEKIKSYHPLSSFRELTNPFVVKVLNNNPSMICARLHADPDRNKQPNPDD